MMVPKYSITTLLLPLVWILITCGGLGMGVGCSERDTIAPALARGVEPNIVFIVIDTLRADRLPFYDGPAHTAPFLASLAEEGLVFDSAWAASSWTAPATASIFTGLYPSEHGVQYNIYSQMRKRKQLGVFMHQRLPDDVETLGELMRRVGYRTYAVSDNPNIGRGVGFDRGFDRFVTRKELDGTGADLVAAQVLDWREELVGGGKYFLYLHFMDPHWPYSRHEQWLPQDSPVPEEPILDIDAYDSEIRYVDEHIRQLAAALDWDATTVILVTADHGQEFLDHGGRGHGFKLYSELIRIPLLIHQKGNETLRGRVDVPVAHVDLLPTLRDFVGEPPREGARGRSVLAAARGERTNVPPPIAMRAGIVGTHVMQLGSVVRGRYKLIRLEPAGRIELYDLEADPREQRNIARQHPEIVEELTALVNAERARARSSPPEGTNMVEPSSETIRQLQALGYTEGGVNEGVPETVD